MAIDAEVVPFWEQTAGESTCPLCSKTWTVTPRSDCCMPACGCYGTDTSDANPNRPCEPCGIRHAMNCVGGDDRG